MKKLIPLVIALVPLTSFAEGFSGPYVGASLGYVSAEDKGTGHNQGSSSTNGWTHKPTPSGASFGLLGGYSWQLNNGLLLGLEADYEGRAENSERVHQQFHGVTDTDFAATSKLLSAASVRARVGYQLNQPTQIYATAGYALAEVKRTLHDFRWPETTESHTNWQGGWTAGIGAEYMLTKNLSSRLEYRYSDYGKKEIQANLWGEYYKEKLTEHAVKVGVSYYF